MPSELFYTLSIVSGMVYAVAALGVKSAMRWGAGPVRVIFMVNWMNALMFLPLLFFSDQWPSLQGIWMPILAGFCSFIGQIFACMAIRIGDVTIQAPLMGMKVIFVALITVLLGVEELSSTIWVAAILTAFAVFILGASGFKNRRSVLLTALFVGIACLFYATQDVLIQKWAPAYGPIPFMVVMMGSLPFFGLSLILFFRAPLFAISKRALKWLFFGAFMSGLQSILFTTPIAFNGEAATVNILYSARGLWSIMLVWIVGHWFHNRESKQGWNIMVQRVLGASLLTSAIAIVLYF